MSTIEIIISKDGSHTLLNKELDETYHSTHGSVQEGKHVFIKEGIQYFKEENPNLVPNILEVGMGTGLNVLLTILFAVENKLKLHITTLEKYPLPKELTDPLNFPEYLGEDSQEILDKIHTLPWNETITFNDYVTFTKKDIGLEQYQNPVHNLIYYDAFAPSKQGEMWTLQTLEKMTTNCLDEAVFVTYCAKGQVRRDLQSLGFVMSKLKGPPGKHEMLRGVLKP